MLVVLGSLRQWWLARKGDPGLIVIVGFNLRRRERRRCPSWKGARWPALKRNAGEA